MPTNNKSLDCWWLSSNICVNIVIRKRFVILVCTWFCFGFSAIAVFSPLLKIFHFLILIHQKKIYMYLTLRMFSNCIRYNNFFIYFGFRLFSSLFPEQNEIHLYAYIFKSGPTMIVISIHLFPYTQHAL